jgi:hypothetical protein
VYLGTQRLLRFLIRTLLPVYHIDCEAHCKEQQFLDRKISEASLIKDNFFLENAA